MPIKIAYSVVGMTSEAEGYSAKHLERQSPTVPGWQTARWGSGCLMLVRQFFFPWPC